MSGAIQGTATLQVGADLRPANRDVRAAARQLESIKINIGKNSKQPLGRITGAVTEFNKSLDASNARVIAFGASAGSIYLVDRAIRSLVKTTVEVQKQLADINVLLRLSSSELKTFSNELFGIARNTAQAFSTVAAAAQEFSRQGLNMEETLKRTNAALVLTRVSGMDAVKSVEALTSTINAFSGAALEATEIVNKLANVDANFAVSSADLASALQRVGSSAQDAGVSFDQLLAIVTTAQQITARGGSVIGNSLKTIFTRLQRQKTVDLLESLGVETRTTSGELKGTIDLLRSLTQVYDKLGAVQKSYVAEQVGGVFQINVLRAALGDLGSQYSIYDRALQTSMNTTDEAIARNKELNETIAALSQQAITNIQQASAKIGNIVFEPQLKGFLKDFNSIFEYFDKLDPDGVGAKMGRGLLKGLGNFITGPGLVMVGGIAAVLFKKFTQFASGSFKELLGLNEAAKKRQAIQTAILDVLSKEESISRALLDNQITQQQAGERIKNILNSQFVIMEAQQKASAQIAANFQKAGFRVASMQMGTATAAAATNIPAAKTGGIFGRAKSAGFIPSLAENIGAANHNGGYKAGRVFKTRIHDGLGRSELSYVNSAEKIINFVNGSGKKATAVVPPNGFGKGTQVGFAAKGFLPLSFKKSDAGFGITKVSGYSGKTKVGDLEYSPSRSGGVEIEGFDISKSFRGKGLSKQFYAQLAGMKVRGTMMPQFNKDGSVFFPQLGRASMSKKSAILHYGKDKDSVIQIDEFKALIQKNLKNKKYWAENNFDLISQMSSGFVPNFAPAVQNLMGGRNSFQIKWINDYIKKKGLPPEVANDPNIMMRLAKIFAKKYPNKQGMFGFSGGFIPNFSTVGSLSGVPTVKEKLKLSADTDGRLDRKDAVTSAGNQYKIHAIPPNPELDLSKKSGQDAYEAQVAKQLGFTLSNHPSKGLYNRENSAIDGYRVSGSRKSPIIEALEVKSGGFRGSNTGLKFLRVLPENYATGSALDLWTAGLDKFQIRSTTVSPDGTKNLKTGKRFLNKSGDFFYGSRKERFIVKQGINEELQKRGRSSGFFPNFSAIAFDQTPIQKRLAENRKAASEGRAVAPAKKFGETILRDFRSKYAVLTANDPAGFHDINIPLNQIKSELFNGRGIDGSFRVGAKIAVGTARYENFDEEAKNALTPGINSLSSFFHGSPVTSQGIALPAGQMGSFIGNVYEAAVNKAFDLNPDSNITFDLPVTPPRVASFFGVPNKITSDFKKTARDTQNEKSILAKILTREPGLLADLERVKKYAVENNLTTKAAKKKAAAVAASGFIPNFASISDTMDLEEKLSGRKAIFDLKPFPHIRNTSQPTFSSAIRDHGGSVRGAIGDSIRSQKSAGLLSSGFVPNFSSESGGDDQNSGAAMAALIAAAQSAAFYFMFAGKSAEEMGEKIKFFDTDGMQKKIDEVSKKQSRKGEEIKSVKVRGDEKGFSAYDDGSKYVFGDGPESKRFTAKIGGSGVDSKIKELEASRTQIDDILSYRRAAIEENLKNRQDDLGTLGLKEGFTPKELKKNYRNLSAQYHPDKMGGGVAATEMMRDINNARERLSGKVIPHVTGTALDSFSDDALKASSQAIEKQINAMKKSQLEAVTYSTVLTKKDVILKKASLKVSQAGLAGQKLLLQTQKKLGNVGNWAAAGLKSSGIGQKGNAINMGVGMLLQTGTSQIAQFMGRDTKEQRGKAAAVEGLGNMASMGATGAMIGGPVGAGVGLAVGAIMEAPKIIDAATNNLPDLEKKAEKSAEVLRKFTESMQKGLNSFSMALEQSMESGEEIRNYSKYIKETLDSFDMSFATEQQENDLRNAIVAGNMEKVKSIQAELLEVKNMEAQRDENSKNLVKDVKDAVKPYKAIFGKKAFDSGKFSESQNLDKSPTQISMAKQFFDDKGNLNNEMKEAFLSGGNHIEEMISGVIKMLNSDSEENKDSAKATFDAVKQLLNDISEYGVDADKKIEERTGKPLDERDKVIFESLKVYAEGRDVNLEDFAKSSKSVLMGGLTWEQGWEGFGVFLKEFQDSTVEGIGLAQEKLNEDRLTSEAGLKNRTSVQAIKSTIDSALLKYNRSVEFFTQNLSIASDFTKNYAEALNKASSEIAKLKFSNAISNLDRGISNIDFNRQLMDPLNSALRPSGYNNVDEANKDAIDKYLLEMEKINLSTKTDKEAVGAEAVAKRNLAKRDVIQNARNESFKVLEEGPIRAFLNGITEAQTGFYDRENNELKSSLNSNRISVTDSIRLLTEFGDRVSGLAQDFATDPTQGIGVFNDQVQKMVDRMSASGWDTEAPLFTALLKGIREADVGTQEERNIRLGTAKADNDFQVDMLQVDELERRAKENLEELKKQTALGIAQNRLQESMNQRMADLSFGGGWEDNLNPNDSTVSNALIDAQNKFTVSGVKAGDFEGKTRYSNSMGPAYEAASKEVQKDIERVNAELENIMNDTSSGASQKREELKKQKTELEGRQRTLDERSGKYTQYGASEEGVRSMVEMVQAYNQAGMANMIPQEMREGALGATSQNIGKEIENKMRSLWATLEDRDFKISDEEKNRNLALIPRMAEIQGRQALLTGASSGEKEAMIEEERKKARENIGNLSGRMSALPEDSDERGRIQAQIDAENAIIAELNNIGDPVIKAINSASESITGAIKSLREEMGFDDDSGNSAKASIGSNLSRANRVGAESNQAAKVSFSEALAVELDIKDPSEFIEGLTATIQSAVRKAIGEAARVQKGEAPPTPPMVGTGRGRYGKGV